MPRLARAVCARVPYHVTQRGNRQQHVFFVDEDRRAYLGWLKEYADKHDVEILAYCLMTNHVHLVAVPGSANSLHWMLRPLHMRYAQYVNRRRGWSGHLWQGRFFASALDEAYLWAALRYVELNPVRARMVRKAEDYEWSSAAGHCGLRKDRVLTTNKFWHKQIQAISDWSAWLTEADVPEQFDQLRHNTAKGVPCGSDKFIRKLEDLTGRSLQYRPRGRPPKKRIEAGKPE